MTVKEVVNKIFGANTIRVYRGCEFICEVCKKDLDKDLSVVMVRIRVLMEILLGDKILSRCLTILIKKYNISGFLLILQKIVWSVLMMVCCQL